ncbi:hypothetical protein [Mycolicibacterium thermoresistibile]|jgi:hypothetical protein|uniref:Uncharacterized protein n=2 Tax=Mycolicibacterium thermoresistibile TaxID=1797 RepID=G7CJF4_MYCT3|nr:hypothetical protein [Mycolicibacterium thermoresistibile]EHI12752.1 hypothetical protein KEK_17673 [Mycolicibacterium thermoresistibile ATCC 19527]MCV7189990.1 hypothetical protein [Mycolicibacterium thermoresistibile]GAT13956.1 putative uncharacterized protein [Mycolicibacterium thermoresistibile]SNW19129.1 Uncharacterised protein [Mycolicibacterium thermoresistibile]
MRGLIGLVVLIWLLIGVAAAWQRDYFRSGETNCATAAQVALTVVAGPLNYMGVNPQVDCNINVPEPSSSGLLESVGQEHHSMNGEAA